MPGDPLYGGLIVGVDGSEASLAALRWSAAKARLLGAPLVAVHAWLPAGPHRAPYAPSSGLPTAEQEHMRALRTLDATVARLAEVDPDAQVLALLDQGPAATVLLRRARHALLLALGRRAREDVMLPALGAVARECVRHAVCPVVTVPDPPEDAKPRDLPWLARAALL
ncbi:universal stress protein [Streptomyces sp. TRM66268-LWL]|uniref:Universal stress protein n=1 Tax=Streptomyces polyasparticus TaxID=2767826 RepID=A0ABR7SML1_9ACTN|nr:universal stress protein [Streptomyces polyasparticus]MBC9715915.1 universal stress protein [Streptomyces polyasparticus]